jgi:hypothetical protein
MEPKMHLSNAAGSAELPCNYKWLSPLRITEPGTCKKRITHPLESINKSGLKQQTKNHVPYVPYYLLYNHMFLLPFLNLIWNLIRNTKVPKKGCTIVPHHLWLILLAHGPAWADWRCPYSVRVMWGRGPGWAAKRRSK